MAHDDIRLGWRLYAQNWILLAALGATLAASLPLTGFSIVGGLRILIINLAICGAAFGIRFWHPDSRLALSIGALGQIGLFGMVNLPLSYIAQSANLPMRDALLARIDETLGLDWMAYFQFFYDRPGLVPYLLLFYAMILWPGFVIPFVLGFTGHFRRLQQFTLALGLSMVATIVLAALLPAMGTYHQFGLVPDPTRFHPAGYLLDVHDVPLVRDGTLRVLNIPKLGGIVTFPSFHSSAAILFLWAFWSVWWARPLALIANAGMLLATPIVGGHYFIDVLGGAVIALLSVAIAERLCKRLARSPAQADPSLADTFGSLPHGVPEAAAEAPLKIVAAEH